MYETYQALAPRDVERLLERHRRCPDVSQMTLADEFGVSQKTISDILGKRLVSYLPIIEAWEARQDARYRDRTPLATPRGEAALLCDLAAEIAEGLCALDRAVASGLAVEPETLRTARRQALTIQRRIGAWLEREEAGK